MITWSVNLNPNRMCPDLAVPRLEDAAGSVFRHLDELGAGAVRIDIFWHWLLPEPGRVNAEAVAWYKAFFAQADRRGVTLFPLLYHPPEWAMKLLATDEAGFLAAWADFCRLVRREFGDAFALVQVWNEPNNFLAALKQDPVLFFEKKIGPLNVPVGVRWETLAALFAIARAELAPGTLLVYNVLTNLSPFLPFKSAWLDWDVFTDRLLALAGDHIDVIALDHYPDTWAPGTGPLEWECLEVAARKVNTPGTPWYGKTVIIGEVGYSNAPNFHMVNGPVKLGRFFPDERCEDTQSRWYGAAMSHLRSRLNSLVFPHNRLQLVNVY
ncbi:MAG: family 1 glycosylhydrolase, partial [Candidatus Sericytochromatia bacterium]